MESERDISSVAPEIKRCTVSFSRPPLQFPDGCAPLPPHSPANRSANEELKDDVSLKQALLSPLLMFVRHCDYGLILDSL